MDLLRSFFFMCFLFTAGAAVKAVSADFIKLSAKTGENCPVWTGLNNDTQAILTSGSDVLLHFDEGDIHDKKENILVDMKTGSIIMLNVQKKDSKVYKLQLFNGNVPGTTRYINLTVTELQPQVSGDYTTVPPTQRPTDHQSHQAVYISVGITAAVAVLILTAWLKKKWIQRKLNQLKNCCTNNLGII